MPHLYLAHELDREGQARQGAQHYWNYLETMGRQPEQRPSADVLIGVVLGLADCQSRSSQPDRALQSYQMAVKLAQQAGEPKLESIANLNQAPLQAQAGRVNEALRLYRRALDLDESAGDKAAAAVDWFVYGQFLEQSGLCGANGVRVHGEIGIDWAVIVNPCGSEVGGRHSTGAREEVGCRSGGDTAQSSTALRDAVAAER